MAEDLIARLHAGDRKALARCISLVENEAEGYTHILQSLHPQKNTQVLGVTGPPGAGKSSLINAMVQELVKQQKKIAILAIDPSSPFNYGALLGDRIRMSEHFNNEQVFIRSMASRGSLGGLAPKVYEVAELLKAAGFDYVIIETVGVGQSEVEIAGMADTTLLVLVPEGGDEIQTIKSGIMEIADLFILNKSDRAGADIFYKNLQSLVHSHASETQKPVLKTVATTGEGIAELIAAVETQSASDEQRHKKNILLAEKALQMIRVYRSRDIDRQALQEEISMQMNEPGFNLYRYLSKWES